VQPRRAFSLLASLKERLKSLVYFVKCVGLNATEMRFHFRQCAGISQVARLFNQSQVFSGRFVAIDFLLKRGIIDLARMLKFTLTSRNKFCVVSNLVLESLDYGIFCVSRLRVLLHQNAFWLGLVGSGNISLAR
jgi:hypothetical protein